MIEITVAIPVYNVEKYVEKSLLSAIEQDFSLPYEVLVIDDKGTDGSMSVVRHVIESHPNSSRVRIVEHQQNKGLGEARNTAIKEADGRYLFFLDSDDFIERNALSKMYAAAEKYMADVVIGSVSRIEEETGKVIKTDVYDDECISHEGAGVYLYVNGKYYHIEAWNKLYRMDFVRKEGLKCVHRIMEDSVFDFKVRAGAKTIVTLSDITLNYNIRKGSILTNIIGGKGTDESAFVFCDILKKIQELIQHEYSNVEGIYDFYYRRIDSSLWSISKSNYSLKQMEYISNEIKDYNWIVPGKDSFVMYRNRLVYLFTKGHETMSRYIRVQRILNSFAGRVVLKFLKLIK